MDVGEMVSDSRFSAFQDWMRRRGETVAFAHLFGLDDDAIVAAFRLAGYDEQAMSLRRQKGLSLDMPIEQARSLLLCVRYQERHALQHFPGFLRSIAA